MADTEKGSDCENAKLQGSGSSSDAAPLGEHQETHAAPTVRNDARRFRVASEVLNFILVIFLLPVVVATIPQALSGDIPSAGVALALSDPPKMKVWWTRDSDVGQRLHIQSRDDREFTVTDVVVNNKRECTLIDRMKGQIQNSGNSDDKKINSFVVTMARTMAPPPPWKFTLGDEHQTVYTCEPIKVDVYTDQGTVSFRLKDEDE
ncbi:hypothetical protein ABIF07_005440 [Bradyrhizobium elkanii]|uniref:hypothetical protein n=1 Tax=Bradyrhizobium elkanii TaxID=29448 RepID=UPI00216A6213|nr:hypothetical protein [Bradyrhizobium elkanii]MCS3687532.1 hypothetical protein [Bradyrhizobium elkanii]